MSASARYWREDIIEPEVTVTPEGEIAIPDTPGRGYEVRADLIERLTVRKEAIRALRTGGVAGEAIVESEMQIRDE